MTDRARSWLDALLTLWIQGGRGLVVEDTLAELARVGLTAPEIEHVIRPLFGLSAAEAARRTCAHFALHPKDIP